MAVFFVEYRLWQLTPFNNVAGSLDFGVMDQKGSHMCCQTQVTFFI